MFEYIAIYVPGENGYYQQAEGTHIYFTLIMAQDAAERLERADWILIDNYTGEILLDKRG
jgi:hypothetical protein